MDAEHAPRPWSYDAETGWLYDANHDMICHIDGGREATRIVQAVNEHEALRATLDALCDRVEDWCFVQGTYEEQDVMAVVADARALLHDQVSRGR